MRGNSQETADLVEFIEEILYGKLYLLCNDNITTYLHTYKIFFRVFLYGIKKIFLSD